ncbi:hypothetical protein UFOVP199_51 [uncultured Caudovirales phage]|uniref:Uncharacterized protein n=1 Tax=uncultured Caudovirales phage TaxID=2100421 RepID=A0A6J7WLX4_9CAUD|nr:hypothetical protein UFOVP199_51 [uncultured Caudovirales phage]
MNKVHRPGHRPGRIPNTPRAHPLGDRPTVPTPIGGDRTVPRKHRPEAPSGKPKKKPTPTQLKIIQNTGKVTERRTSNKAQKRTCPKCRQTILAGLDAPTCALDVNLDPTPLDRPQQLAAIIIRAHIYDINQTGHINWRHPTEIINRPPPPGTTRHLTHSCGQTITNNNPTPPPTPQPDTNERPPF